jgi:hypothetical protein
MDTFAYQTSSFAYQGSGAFAYQGLVTDAEPAVVVYGGDDAPRKRRRSRKERRDLFRDMEQTVHALLHPEPLNESAGEMVPAVDTMEAQRVIDELVAVAEGQHALLQRVAALRTELTEMENHRTHELLDDDDEALLWMF